MTCPTADEIRLAHEGIDRDGPLAEATLELCARVLRDPTLRGVLERMAAAKPLFAGSFVAPLAGAMASGLNYGLRIGEQRAAALAEQRRAGDPKREPAAGGDQ